MQRPIDLTASDVIIQYLLTQNQNAKSKHKVQTGNFEKSAISINLNESEDKLDLKNLRYMTDEKLNKFSTGYENNNYLILSVINDRYEVFEFLLNEKKIDITFRNSNGWNVLHFIIKYQRFSKYLIIQNFCLYFSKSVKIQQA